MKIYFLIGSRRFFLWLPYRLFFNRLAAFVISKVLKSNGFSVRSKVIYAIIKALKKEIKNYKKLTALEVDTADGFKLSIRL